MMPAMPSISTSSPIVTTTAFSGGLFSTGRMTTRSITPPSTRPAASATTNPSQYEPVWLITVSAM